MTLDQHHLHDRSTAKAAREALANAKQLFLSGYFKPALQITSRMTEPGPWEVQPHTDIGAQLAWTHSVFCWACESGFPGFGLEPAIPLSDLKTDLEANAQSQLQFLPERSTDFIFAVLGEEFGLLGVGLLILIYLFVFWRGMVLALRAQDNFGRLLGGSLMLTFFVYIFVNTGMVTGLVPVVGVPLPLVSYGGTSMVTLMAGFGILMSINSHRRFMS